jgi:hypothetical protein
MGILEHRFNPQHSKKKKKEIKEDGDIFPST